MSDFHVSLIKGQDILLNITLSNKILIKGILSNISLNEILFKACINKTDLKQPKGGSGYLNLIKGNLIFK